MDWSVAGAVEVRSAIRSRQRHRNRARNPRPGKNPVRNRSHVESGAWAKRCCELDRRLASTNLCVPAPRGRSLVVKLLPSKQVSSVRFRPPAPNIPSRRFSSVVAASVSEWMDYSGGRGYKSPSRLTGDRRDRGDFVERGSLCALCVLLLNGSNGSEYLPAKHARRQTTSSVDLSWRSLATSSQQRASI